MTLYHCDGLRFGKARSLTVMPNDAYPVEPTLFILSPLQPEGLERKSADPLGPDVCLATDFRPKGGEMVLNTTGDQLRVRTVNAVLSQKKKTYFYAEFSKESIHSCELNGINEHGTAYGSNLGITVLPTDTSAWTAGARDRTADPVIGGRRESQMELNFYLLVMNAVRVIFTKTVAFNTILTIRAVLF